MTSVYFPVITNFTAGQVLAPWAVGPAGQTGTFNITTGIFTASTSGIYSFYGQFQIGIIQPVLYINGSPISQLPCSVTMTAGQTGALVAPINLTMMGGINTEAGVPWSFLNINLINPAPTNFATPNTGGIIYGLSDNNSNANTIMRYGGLTGGVNNTCIGATAGFNLTTGSQNTALGAQALSGLTGVNHNTAVGYQAGASTQGAGNTIIGSQAGLNNVSGTINVYVGRLAGSNNAVGQQNVYLGYASGGGTGGSYNVGIGGVALGANATSFNTAVGYASGQALVSGQYNTAIGFQSLNACTGGTQNVAVGFNAGGFAQSGNGTYVGTQAGANIVTGDNNTAIGFQAMGSATGCTGNICIGNSAGFNIQGSNNIEIGHTGATGDANVIRLGKNTHTSLYCPAASTSLGATGAFSSLIINSSGQIGVGAGGLQLLGSVVLGATAANISFTSIPNTYRMLKLYVCGRTQYATKDYLQVSINGDTTAANYPAQYIQGANSTANAGFTTGTLGFPLGECPGANAGTGYASSAEVTLPNYTSTTFYKNFMVFNSSVNSPQNLVWGGQWLNTAAITSLTLTSYNGAVLSAGTLAYLYAM